MASATMDERLKWLETRINSSLRPKNEDVKNMFMNDENRLAFHEFINNEDVKRLFVFVRPPRQIIASLLPPQTMHNKSIFFLKAEGAKLTKDNISTEVSYLDCSSLPLEHLDMTIREVYLPLLCADQTHATASGVSADKLMDILHRLMNAVEVSQGHVDGKIVLPLPSIEVLAEAAANPTRRGAVLHVLESTVIGWIKQIKGVLKHDAIGDLNRQYGSQPGPLDEVDMWNKRLDKLKSINNQLDSPVAIDILLNLEEANSTYAHSFHGVRKEISKALIDTEENLMFLKTLTPWFEALHEAVDPKEMLKLFPPLIHTLMLVWQNSRYYHAEDKYHNMLRLISNEVVHRAMAMVGADVLREPLESYSKLKEALRVCAAYRGTYLDYKDKADEINTRNVAENAEKMIRRPTGEIWTTKLYGPHAYQPKYGLRRQETDVSTDAPGEEELFLNSPWPPRNAPCFDLLNSFMERCNDVLELVQTTRHFRLLADAAEIGGAGSHSLDALVREIHSNYARAMDDFFAHVGNVLSVDGTQAFEKAFFTFRTVVKDLERKIAGILRMSFQQCPTIGSQLRLLEVFEGISSRELVQANLKDKDQRLVRSFTEELIQVRTLFQLNERKAPLHKNFPPVVSKLLWVYGLKQRIQDPMDKMKRVSPHSLQGDAGWQLRDAFSEAMGDLQRFETKIVKDWQENIAAELTARLKQPLLVAEEYDEETEIRPQVVHVNLDPKLLLLLREIHYLSQEPFHLKLPAPARELLRNTNSKELRVIATRLETIVSNYNTVMKNITDFEKPLFERKLAKIDSLFEQGLYHYTWKTEESADFIEQATALVCMDVHQNLDIVQTNCHDIATITSSWSQGVVDVFGSRDPARSYHMHELISMQNKLIEDFESHVTPGGNRVHSLLESSFVAVEISQASPAWEDYVDYIDAIVLDGLKQSTLTSLRSMLNTIVQANLCEGDDIVIPILTIRLELIDNAVAYKPPLDQTTSDISVQETVEKWLNSFLERGKLVTMMGPKGTYQDYIEADVEVQQLVDEIIKVVKDNAEECKKLYELFQEYEFLWIQDVNQTFQDFLSGKMSPNPLRTSAKTEAARLRDVASARSSASRVSSAKSSIEEAGLMGTAEKTFLTPKQTRESDRKVPSIDEFDSEIDIYRRARDEISELQGHQDVGWLRVDLKPIKQVLTTYASKWMWTFTKYLSDQVTNMLEGLDQFLRRTEPEIESITGEERDTASFMKMMRLFNEVSAQQQEMDGKFAAMHRTVLLLKKYGQKLPESTQLLFNAAPGRWNNLKTKVSLAKQRLGPRIQEESERITKDLAAFGERVMMLNGELESSDVYQRDCSIGDAWTIIDNFVKRLTVLENEAQDLIELQDLLETSVVNFSVLPQCRHELNNLKHVWETVRIIDEQQSDWKRHRWQKMNTKFLREETGKQIEVVRALPEDIQPWDVFMGLHESITTIQACLPLIDDLSNPAMRTRHWKQLVRVTGGAIAIDNDTLKRMTLGELLGLGLQKHVDDVRAIVQRAVKDLSIEQSLKTYEEVWLSKLFELRAHVRNKTASTGQGQEKAEDNHSETASQAETGSQAQGPTTLASRGQQVRANSRISNPSTYGKNRRASVGSLPASLVNLGEDTGVLYLLTNTDPIFEELEVHQVALQTMQGSSAAGSFLDEVMKWQKRLQTIEAVLTTWLEVQEKWVELEEIYSGADIKTTLSNDASMFSITDRDFRLLMRATEKNPNVLQCSSRKNILSILERMNGSLEHCRRSLLNHLERRRQKFPRFYFLSMEDVLHIVCNGYDINQVNLYINKLFENVGSLMFEEVEDNEKYNFQITGLQSLLGEKLPFKQPIHCEGQIESWLPSFLQAIKTALQYQMALATGVEKPPKVREIHSAGARRVTLPSRDKGSRGKEKPPSRSNSRQASRQDSKHGTRQHEEHHHHRDNHHGDQHHHEGAHSRILDHVAEVVHLLTQTQLTQQVEEALKGFDGGNKQALQASLDKVNSSLQATVIMLKGIEDEKEKQARKDKFSESEKLSLSQRDNKEKSETMSETMSYLGKGSLGHSSLRGSKYDLNIDNPQTPIPEEGGEHSETAEVPVEPHTDAPVDTMNLTNMDLIIVKKEQEEAIEEEIDPTELKLMLFPSQIQKISSLISLLARQRDLLERLSKKAESSNTNMMDSFDWQSQLRYTFEAEGRNIKIQCLDSDFEYGYEYMGSAQREVVTPLCEKAFFTLSQAVKANMGGLCMGPAASGKLETVHELSRSLGRPLYTFNCTAAMDSFMLHDIFRGFATTGSWICFNKLTMLDPTVLSVCAQLLTAVHDALRAQKTTINLGAEELPLNPQGACFALIDSSIKATAGVPEKLMLFNSAVSALPNELLDQFRTVTLTKPDLRLVVEVMLISQGFTRARELAHKTVLLYEMCSKLVGTNTPIKDNIKLGTDANEGSHGWSLQTLKYVASEAGAILDTMTCIEMEEEERNEAELAAEEVEPEKHEKEQQEKSQKGQLEVPQNLRKDEDEALVTSLRNTFMPRLLQKDASVFTTLVIDLWPNVDIPMEFGGLSKAESEAELMTSQQALADSVLPSRAESRKSGIKSAPGSKPASRGGKKSRGDSYKESGAKDSVPMNTPVVGMASALVGNFASLSEPVEKQPLEDINDAIAVATGDLGLMPGTAFQARVVQLSHLNTAHQTIIVTGPAGCGKSECIKTFAVAERERGKTISIQSIFTKALESEELLGYVDPYTKEWRDGLLPSLLRKFCIQSAAMNYDMNTKPVMKMLQLDGELDPVQLELMESILHNDGAIVLGNNERVIMPDNLRFMWEVDSLHNVSPSILATVGILCMTNQDVGWKLILAQWLEHRPETDRDLIKNFCDNYIPKILEYLGQCTSAPMEGKNETGMHYTRMIRQTDDNMITTLTGLFETLVAPYTDLSDVEYERYFNFACIWAFAGTLEYEHRESFNLWWRQEFESHIDYPEDGTVFDYMVDSESHEFCKWADIIPSYTATPHVGIPPEAFVHTVTTEQISYLLGLLSDVGKPVMLVGKDGCGKSAIVADRIRTVCSGEVAEVLALAVIANRFTNAKLLYSRLDERLEWKHGRTYVPKGNKRLMCLVDDLNLAQVDKYSNQSAVELVRQHIDDGGMYNTESHAWRYIKNVTYVTTVNPHPSASVPKLSQRLLRHFCVFGCPYPGNQEQHTIFNTLMHTHFITPEMSSLVTISASAAHHLEINDEKVQNVIREEEEALKKLIAQVVKVNVELQGKLKTMFLPTSQRCHYIFTMKDLLTVFRNLCLSLRPGCNKDSLLQLWQHECSWVYGQRMGTEVDRERYQTAFATAVRKEFSNEDQIQLLLKKKKPLFSNLIEQDSGMVTAGNIIQRSDVTPEQSKTDMYVSSTDEKRLKYLLERGVEEYNKAYPRIKLPLYRTVIEQVCRLARIVASPHEVAHTVLVADGDPGRCTIMARLAAHLSGFSVFSINPSPIASPVDYKMDVFKGELSAAYTKAGVRSEKTLFAIHEEDLLDEDFMVFLTEFVVNGAISHLYSYEEQTTIINSIRTEVTQAGLTYTREVAWEFFLKTVRKNFRICLIASSGGPNFQRICREYPAFTKNVNFIWFSHWSRQQLVNHASYHLKDVKWMNKIQKENIAHMLSSMHIAIHQQDGQEKGSGEYRHITNTTYEKFVERFISVANARHSEIGHSHDMVTKALEQIHRENTLATKLHKQLEHEKIVLEERKAGTIKILSQIGQDTAITEQQVKIVKSQMEKIQKLKKLLPEYQVAHERAVYKAIAIVGDTKKIVQEMDMESLHELRAMQKPIIDIEDLMAAIIMILKSPSADLTWHKGGKRQMANLERFTEELMSFDDNQLPESTLNLVEPYLKKPSFDPETILKKTATKACASLCKWVRGVVRYHRMMLSKVKPLHAKVEQTTQAVDNAEQKMNQLENKRKALDIRLADLAKGFEEATIDKNDQEEKTIKMDKMLETAARLRKILKREHLRCQQIHEGLRSRQIAIPGGSAIASAFTTYLGPYHYNFRRLMLTVHWPNCLRERGIPLVIDSIDHLRGRVIDFSIEGLKTAAGASGLPAIEEEEECLEEGKGPEAEGEEEGNEEQTDPAVEGALPEQEGATVQQGQEQQDNAVATPRKSREGSRGPQDTGDQQQLARIQEEHENATEPSESGTDGGSIPLITAQQYNQYVRSLVKLLVGEKTLYEWIRKDFGPRQIENAAIAYSSWQRPPMLVDPYGEGISWLKWLNRSMNKKKLIILDVDTRSDPQVMVAIEKAIMKGRPVLLENCENNLDSMIMPLIHHRNTAYENDENEEPRMIRFCGRRILCHPDFRLNLATRSHKPQFSPHVASRTTLINYGMSGETLVEDLLSRAFARVRPELYKERKLALKNIHRQKEVLDRIMEYSKRDMLGHGDSWDEREVEFISDAQQKKTQMAQKLHETQLFLEELDMLKDELFPIARRGAMLYAILRSMSAVQREYQFTLPSFLALFDEAVGGDFPEEYYDESDAEDDYDDEDSTVQEQQGYRAGSTSTKSRTSHRQPKEDQSAKGSHYEHKSDVDSTGMGALSDKKTHGKGGGRSSRGDLAYEGDFEDEHNEGNTQQEEEGETDINDDPEKLPAWELPDIPDLPSEGVDYSSMAEDQVKTLVDAVTTTLYQHIKQSLYDEHALLFATMVTLNIQVEGGADFSDEELSLLLQGNPGIGMTLTLADFESQASDPDWIAKDRWDDILAMSVLPGPLDAICCHIAEFSEAWKAWYNLPEPETAAMPNDKNEGDTETQPQKNTEEEDDGIPEDPDIPLTDFHRMLLVRMMRPDRTPAAMATYVNKYLAPHLTAGREPKLSDIQRLMKGNEYGLLVLLPPTPACSDQHPTSSLNMIEHPRETLLNMAKVGGIDVEHVVMGEGCEHQVEKALEEGQKKDCWILIENLHLSPQSFYKPLKNHLARLAKMIATEEKNTLVWITSEPSSRVPPQLIQCLHTLSWQFVGPQLVETPKEEETIDLTFNFGSLKSVLPSAIAYALNTTPLSYWERVKTFSQPLKLLIYGVGVIQGALLARQTFGSQGLSQWSTLSKTHMVQVIDMVDGAVSRKKDPSVEELGPIISKMVYGNILVNAWDQDYSAALVAAVMKGLQAGAITLGDVQIPMPSAGTEPTDYGTWVVEQMKEDSNSLQALSLHTSVEKEYNESSGIEFLDHLDKLYETQNMDISSDVTPAKTVDTMKLRNAIDKCTESMPPLLMLGDAPQQETDEEYSFPYHWPSVVSLASASSTLMPESIGHVLLQECQWLNSLLCYIRQNIYDIRNSLVGGTESLPNPLKEAVFCLQEEYVPVTWVHPNKQPCTHTLDSWLTDLRKHYSQLNSWVKSGMVPTYDKEGNVSNSGIARGSLNVLWLGGLVKPQALFTALRQEKAVVMETTMDEIALSCEVLEGAVIEQMEVQDEGGLYIRDLLMQGACWDGENGSLAPATSFLYPMPLMYVKPVMRSELEEMKQQISLYDVPVFMNRARQVCALTLPLASKDPVETWQLATVALILDPGVPEDAHRKPRKHAAVKAMPYHVGDADAARALSTRQANTADLFEGAESQMDARMSARSRLSARSYHSQMSYRPMSPRAPPLPPDLQMHREQVMTEVSDEPEQSPRSQAGSQQGQKQQTNLPQNKFPSNDSLGKQSQKSVGSRKKGSLNRPPSEQSRKSVEGGIATGPESRPLSRHSRDAEEGVTEGAQGQSPKASQAGSVKGQSPRASQAGSVKGQSPRASQAGSVKGQSPAASQAGSVKGESPRGGSQAGSVKGQPQGSEGQRSRRPSQQSATKESDENKSDSEKQASAGE